MNDLFCDIGYHSLNKDGETLCGDRVQCVSPNEDDEVIVLADGLGSGVKANILSTLTSKIISTMVAGGMSIEDCAMLPTPRLRLSESSGTMRRKSSSTITRMSSSCGTESIFRCPNRV